MRAVPVTIIFVITVYFSIITMTESRAAWLCKPCSYEQCDEEPSEFCLWGEARNDCNRRVCAKGPGERCGGRRDIFGKCGKGMWCQQEEESAEFKCHGCYDDTLECHQSGRY